jgi:hypothetical protein
MNARSHKTANRYRNKLPGNNCDIQLYGNIRPRGTSRWGRFFWSHRCHEIEYGAAFIQAQIQNVLAPLK